jgi:phosphatidylserine decarboxylase
VQDFKKLFLIMLISISTLFMCREVFMGKKVLVFEDGEIIVEKTEALWCLRFFYFTRLGRIFRRLIPKHFFSRVYGFLQSSSFSRRKIKPFIKKHNINISEYVVPGGGFSSFNDFFIRKLKPGARTIDTDSSVLVSPADSRFLVIPEISLETRFFVKSKQFCLKTFLRDDFLAEKFKNGTLLLFRLAPYDYHRYHFPTDSVPSKKISISGDLESVSPLVFMSGGLPLHENERQISILKTKEFGDLAFVTVGAMMVGKIIQTFLPDKEYKKGDEMGYFSFGGSSIVILIESGKIIVDQNFIDNSKKNIETSVKMGQRIGAKVTR